MDKGGEVMDDDESRLLILAAWVVGVVMGFVFAVALVGVVR